MITSLLVSSIFVKKEEESYLYKKEVEKHITSCKDDEYLVIAHRGFSSIEIENTEKALTSCNNVNCIDGVEIDIRMTKDEIPILFHNPKIKEKKVQDITLLELQNMVIKENFSMKNYLLSYKEKEMGYEKRERFSSFIDKSESILTLEEALKLINISKILLVDIKFEEDEKRNEQLIQKVSTDLKKSNFSQIIIQSDNPFYLKKMKEEIPYFSYQLIINKKEGIEKYYPYFDSFAVKENMVTKSFIEDLRNHHKKISIWTINDYENLYKIEKEVAPYQNEISYITDYPDFICYAMQKQYMKK